MELTFTAIDSAAWVQLDSIKVMNRTQGGDTVLYYPDTVLVLDYTVGLPDARLNEQGFLVYQNYPNPVSDQTTVSMYVPEHGQVSMIATDLLGQMLLRTDKMLNRGIHSFRLNPGNGGILFFSAQWKGNVGSIKVLQTTHGNSPAVSLEYLGSESGVPGPKIQKEMQGGFDFSLGDELLFIGYTDTLESGILNAPVESQTYTFQFAYDIPCPGTPNVSYEGQVYNTVQIFSQCWLKENLNAGVMIDSLANMSDNDTIEKYCYGNQPDSCAKYGGLYQWDEMMQYTHEQGARGICPVGWHLPSDEEWKVLEGAVDSQYGIGDNLWGEYGLRGYDAGANLKTTISWNNSGNGNNLVGYSGLPGGSRIYITLDEEVRFSGVGLSGVWWTSSDVSNFLAWLRRIQSHPGIKRSNGTGFEEDDGKEDGFSVRCLKNEPYTSPTRK